MFKSAFQSSIVVLLLTFLVDKCLADTPIEPTSPAREFEPNLTESGSSTLPTNQDANKLTGSEQQANPKVQPTELQFKSIRQLSLRISPTKKAKQTTGYFPTNRAQQHLLKSADVEHPIGYSRTWSVTSFAWQPTQLCHGPLYFEETNAERYGNSVCMQPFVSAMHFFGTIPVMFYKWALQPPWQCNYTLGYDRPGNNVPFQLHLPPRNRDGIGAAAVQGAVATGLFFVFP